MTLGVVKRCLNCGDENYVKPDTVCPSCGKDFSYSPEKKSPDIIVFLGTPELNRRTVVQLRKMNLIDNFR